MSLSRWHDTGSSFAFGAHQIFVNAQGSGGEALLLLHGFPTASWDFEAIWPALCKRFAQVITVDLLGFGFSDKPLRHRYTIAEQAELCVSLLRARGVERVHLLAHDYGVHVAQELLARAAEQADGGVAAGDSVPPVLSCIFLNGALFPESARALPRQRLMRTPLLRMLVRWRIARRFNADFARLFGTDTQPGMIELHDYRELIGRHQGWRVLPRLLHHVDERRRQRERWSATITQPRQPQRLIVGLADPIAGAGMVARYRQLLPQADIVELPGIGHYPQLEAPDRVMRAVHAFHDQLDDARDSMAASADIPCVVDD